jgi:hypothetical protein
LFLGVISDWRGFEAGAVKNKKSHIFVIKRQKGGGKVLAAQRDACRCAFVVN